jgi:hypothetical protein
MTTIYTIQFDTAHFTFSVYAKTAAECNDLLARAVRKHIRETGADPEYFADLPQAEAVRLGQAYRDGMEYGRSRRND